jgi:xanthine dehydrogenase accessory factor
MFEQIHILVKGGGDLATGVVFRLWRARFPVVVTELPKPTAIRRAVAVSEAVYEGEIQIEDMTARRASTPAEMERCWNQGIIPVFVDPQAELVSKIHPRVVVDAIMAKHNLGTQISDAPLVIALGPGFTVGVDAHAVIETNRGHFLGRALWQGSAEVDTGLPGTIQGVRARRVIYSPADGFFAPHTRIGAQVEEGEVLGKVGQAAILAPIAGIVRGLIHESVPLHAGMKIGDVDPRGVAAHCWTISDKALAVGGGVLEAVVRSAQALLAN